MKLLKLFTAVLLLSSTLLAQTSLGIPGAPGYQLPQTIVTQKWFGVAAPTSALNYPSLPGDMYFDTTGTNAYWCAAPVYTKAPACQIVTAGQWTLFVGSGGASTGSGSIVRQTSPTLITPVLGVATATSINRITLTQPATGSTITVADGKTLTANNSITLVGTDADTYTFPAASVSLIGGSLSDCATTAACPSTAQTGVKLVQGRGTLATGSPSTYAVTTISPAFTSATTYNCYAQDTTTLTVNIGVLTAGYVSGTAVTFTGPNTNTDTFRWYCVGY